MSRAQVLMDQIGLEPHPEGGYFKETYRSPIMVDSPQVNASRNAITDIHFLLQEGQFSRFHQVKHEEIWYWHEGADLELILWDGLSSPQVITLGPIDGLRHYKYVVPAGLWQAARCTGEYTLVSCCVAPGFDFADFHFLPEGTEVSEDFQYLV